MLLNMNGYEINFEENRFGDKMVNTYELADDLGITVESLHHFLEHMRKDEPEFTSAHVQEVGATYDYPSGNSRKEKISFLDPSGVRELVQRLPGDLPADPPRLPSPNAQTLPAEYKDGYEYAWRDQDVEYKLVLHNGRPTVSSLDIAEVFKKKHRDVLKAVKNLDCTQNFTERNFALSEYLDSTGRKLPVEVTTSSDDLSYFLLVWNVVTILQHFLFCKWQGIQECLHRRFPIAILPAVRT